jgi:ribosomal protein S18 acetylase RimI-like enzyme
MSETTDDRQRAADDVVIRWIRPDEVEVYRAFRLRALADTPEAFGDSYALAIARPPEFWHQRVADTSAGLTSVLVVAVDAATGTWLGMTGSYIDEDAPDVAEVVSVWVAPEARRQGLARRLMDGVAAWGVSRGTSRQRLWVTETNLRAQNLYLSSGYTKTGVMHPLPSNPTLQEYEMVRRI